jgi:hypothetical protein
MPALAPALSARMSLEEKSIVRRMHFEQKLTPREIADATGRHLSSIVRNLQTVAKPKKMGRPPALSESVLGRLEKTVSDLVVKADGKKEVTVAMVKTRLRLKCCERVVSDALHKRNIYFRALRSKPRLTDEDIKERFAFAKKYKGKTKAWWIRTLHMVIDLKRFSVYVNAEGRAYAARRMIRGAYRKPGQGLDKGYVKPPKALKYNPGVKSGLIAAGIGGGKVRVWAEIQGRWTGAAAADFYGDVLLKALKKAQPTRRKYTVLEDNDPTGFKSKKGKEAKSESGINVFAIPKRSPDLNVCDYALWQEVSRCMREQEKTWKDKKRETRDEYLQRLRRTAMTLPKHFVDKAIGDMKRRCQRLYAAKGHLFEEGGRSQ